MIKEVLGKAAISAFMTHIERWISNLKRAGKKRKQESQACLKRVILAVRKTAVYCRSLKEGRNINYDKETEIAMEWTRLGIELEQLKLTNLAKKCRVKGWYWENHFRYDKDFLSKAQISFEQVERQASKLLRELN